MDKKEEIVENIETIETNNPKILGLPENTEEDHPWMYDYVNRQVRLKPSLNTWVVVLSSSPIVTLSGTQTLTNKRITPRVTTITTNANPTVNTDDCDCVTITAQAGDIASMTTNLSGTPTNFQRLIYRIKDDGTARAIAWGAKFVAMGVALPTTTVISKLLTVEFIYDTVTSVWGCVKSNQEA